jgi:restriction endonuclease Mrr
MTKRRHPLTFENAMTAVASHIGWKETARIVGRSESTVRAWSDNDIKTTIPLEAALALDIAFHQAGGEGAPFFNCYANQVEAARADACPEIQAMITSAAKVAKETGEAIEATLDAATINASLADIAVAERELEQAINAHHNSLALLRARRKHLNQEEGTGEPPEEPVRDLEVSPPQMTA